jgi:ribosomal protein S18 acetylase RimI-like enzyme
MTISRKERVRMERAHVLAWPALNTAVIEGWLWRLSGGGSQRANSVSAVDFHGTDLPASVAEVEAKYSARGAPARFQSYDETSPLALAELLRTRGYQEGEPTMTMFKRIERSSPIVDPRLPAEIEQRDHPWAEWRSCYLGEITESRRAVNSQILDRVPQPRAFFGYRRDGQIVSTALCVVGFGCAVIECVATRAEGRRQGTAHAVLVALEAWVAAQDVTLIGLQVVPTNTAAVTLYRRLGFEAGATNRFWVKDFEQS